MAKKKEDAAKAKNIKQQENKTPELAAAKKAFEKYFKDNGLDPTKDYTKDKTHGKAIKKLLLKLNKERDKVAAKFPESDPSTMKLIKKGAKKKADREAKVNHIQKTLKEEKEKKVVNRTLKYDYPLIDGREMTSAEKKKYRIEQRKLRNDGTNGNVQVPKEKKVKKDKKTEVNTKNKKKKVKVNKEED